MSDKDNATTQITPSAPVKSEQSQQPSNHCDQEMVAIGDFGRPQGLDGSIRINSYTDPIDNIFNYSPWTLADGHKLEVACWRQQGKRLIAIIEGIATRDSAALLTGQVIYLPRSELPETAVGEYYWHDLHGLMVFNLTGVCLGEIKNIFPGSGFAIIAIKPEKGADILIPYRSEVVRKVDLEQKTMQVDWDALD